jgi:hypothetical protein
MPIRENRNPSDRLLVSIHLRGFQQYLCTFPEESYALIAYQVTKSKAKPSRWSIMLIKILSGQCTMTICVFPKELEELWILGGISQIITKKKKS